MRHVIWSNDVDTSDEAIEKYRTDVLGCDPDEYTDEEVVRFMYRDVDDNLDDERANVRDVEMEHSNAILCVGTLGLWHGTVMGYKLLENATLDKIFGVAIGDYVEFYEEDGNVQCSDTHHDGTNHYVFRELGTDDLDDPGVEEMLGTIESAGKDEDRQTAAWKLVNGRTCSLSHYWKDLYGWTD